MSPIELYEFDRNGYLVIPGILSPAQVEVLLSAALRLEEHAADHLGSHPQKRSAWGIEGHMNPELGYQAHGRRADGYSLVIEDFWNADPAFHCLIDHEPTLKYIRSVVLGRATINNSELRVRYSGNATGSHMGGPIDHKYRYAFSQGKIDCMMVRMIYFLHDVTCKQGAFSVVPGSHKSNYPSPYGTDSDDEPGLIGLEVKAGDAILFTENLRHGGLTNRSDQTRRTLHVGYGPHWMMSQNIMTMDEPQFLTEATRSALTPRQRAFFVAWPSQEV